MMMIDGRPLNCIESDLNHAKYFFVTFPQYSFSLEEQQQSRLYKHRVDTVEAAAASDR